MVQWAAYVVHLISNCPNLERFQFMFLKCDASKDVVERFIHHEMPHNAQLKQLKRVDIKLMLFSELEMEFLKHVLSSATALEKICIVTSAEFSDRGMKMIEEMKQSSPNVEFIYKEVNYFNILLYKLE